MLTFKSILRFIIIWLVTSTLSVTLGYLKNELDHKYKITAAWYYIQNYGLKSLMISSTIYLLITSIIYYLMAKSFKKYFQKLWLRIIIIELIALFLLPFLFPFNRFPDYLVSFKEFWQYTFGLSSLGIAAAFIPFLDDIITKIQFGTKNL